MATAGTPYQGLDYAAARVYGSQLSVVCYTNAANSLSDTSTYASLVQPAQTNGYAPILLDGTWSFANGVVTYLTSGANPRWTATGIWSSNVTGMAIVDVASGKLLHFRDNTVVFVAANLKKLECDLSTILS